MMDIPFDSPIAVNTRTNQMQDKLEQQQMKKLVLNHEMRQEDHEKKSASCFLDLHLYSMYILEYKRTCTYFWALVLSRYGGFGSSSRDQAPFRG